MEAKAEDDSCDSIVSDVDAEYDDDANMKADADANDANMKADADANDDSGDDTCAADSDSNVLADADADLATVTDLGLTTSTLIGGSWHPVW